MTVFWRRGFQDTSVDHLLEAMNLNAGSLYSTFGDKNALFERAFDRYEKNVFGSMFRALDSDDSPLAGLRKVVGSWPDAMMKHKGCLLSATIVDLHHSKKIAKRARAVIRKAQAAFERKLLEAIEAEELPRTTPYKEWAASLVNTAQGLTVMARAGASRQTLQGIVNTALLLLK